MAGETPGLNITVTIDTSGVQAGVDKATAGVKEVAAEADKTASRFSNLKAVMIGTFASSEIQKGLSDLEGFLKDSVKVAEEAQTSITGLATAMNNAKVNTEANREVVGKVTESMANLGFTGNSTREALTKLVTASGSVTQAQKMMGVAADYARVKHIDLNEAATILSRGTTGAVRAFREYGITLDSSLPKNQAIAKAFDELNQKIGGQAAAYAETYAGKLAILGVKTNDLKEKVGTLLLPVLTKLSTWFIDSLEWIAKHKVAMEAIAILFGAVLTPIIINMTVALAGMVAEWLALNWPIMAVVAALAAVAAGFTWAWNKFQDFRHGVVAGIEGVLDVISFLVHAIGFVAEAFLQVVTGPMRLMLHGLGFFVPAAKTAAQELDKMPKAVGDFFDGAANKIDSFKKSVESVKDTKINIKLPNFESMLATAGGAAGQDPGILGQAHEKTSTAAAKAAAKNAAELKKNLDELTKLHTEYQTALKDRQDKMDAAMAAKIDRDTAAQDNFNQRITDLQAKHDDAMQAAQDKFDQASADSHQAYTDKITQIDADFAAKKDDLLTAYNEKIASLEQAAADKAVQIEQAAADKRQSIVQQSIDLLTSAWASATKIDVGSLFTKGSESSLLSTTVVNGIVTSVVGAAKGTADGLKASLQDKLKEIQQLQEDAGKLAAAGYSQSFIQEVLAQGPTVGDQMAKSLLSAAPDTQASIQSLYGQIQDTSATGLDALATQMNSGAQLATQKLMDQYAQVDVTLQTELAKNAATLQTSIATENATYAKALDAATDAHTKATDAATATLNNALKKENEALTAAQEAANKAFSDGQIAAQDTLTKALEASQKSYDTAIKAISDSTMKQLDALQAKISATALAIVNLGGTASSSDFFFSAPAMAPTPYGPGITTTSPSAGSTGSSASTAPLGSSSPTSGSDKYSGITINAPISVDGSTAPVDIQNKLLSITKFGVGLL